MAFDPSTAQPIQAQSSSSGSFDPSTAQPIEESSTGALGTIDSAAMGFSAGALDAVNAMGSLANNILKTGSHVLTGSDVPSKMMDRVGDIAQAGIDKVKSELAPQTDFENQAVAEHPIAYGIGGGLGNVGMSTGLAASALNPVSKVLTPAISKILPGAANSPVVANAMTQGALGAITSAEQNPAHPLRAATIGGAAGLILGAVTGNAGENVNQAGQVISDTMEDFAATGKDPYSLASLRVLQGNLKNEGLEYRQYDIEQEAKQTVNDIMDRIRPNAYEPGTSPVSLIANKTIANAETVEETNTLNYKPINDNTQTFPTENYNQIKENLKTSLPKLGLPMKPVEETTINPDTGEMTVTKSQVSALPPNPTLNDMLGYRKVLDGTIRQAQMQAANGKISNQQVFPYYQIRNALNQDIHQAAASVPYENPLTPQIKTLDDQLNMAEKFNINNVQPFKLIDKNGNILNNPKVEAKIWTTISAQLQARRPNFTTIQANAARLGPDGKELLGWGMIENAINRATSIEGKFNPRTVQSALTRMQASGILDTIGTSEQKDVALGISKVLEASSRIKITAPNPGFIGSKIQALTHSRAGIGLLRRIGSPSASAQTVRTIMQQLLTGTVATVVSQPDENQK